jgi:hypothetical protein
MAQAPYTILRLDSPLSELMRQCLCKGLWGHQRCLGDAYRGWEARAELLEAHDNLLYGYESMSEKERDEAIKTFAQHTACTLCRSMDRHLAIKVAVRREREDNLAKKRYWMERTGRRRGDMGLQIDYGMLVGVFLGLVIGFLAWRWKR